MKIVSSRNLSLLSLLPLMTFPVAVLAIQIGLSCSAGAQAAPTQPPTVAPQDPNAAKITSIVVIGNKVLNSQAVIALSGHKEGDACNQQILSEMKTNLFNTGYFGYHDGTINPDGVRVRSEESAGKCNVVIEVEENPKIETVQVTGSGPIKPEEIKKLIRNTPVYSEAQFALDVAAIQEKYRTQGYIAVVGGEAGPDANNPSVLNVPIIVTKVAEIKIAKNKKTRDRVILREMKTKVGDYFNARQLERDRAKLFNLDLFEEVIVQDRDMGLGLIGLTISVPEKRTGQVLAGVGFSNRQQLIGFAQIAETNFRGLGESINLRWETGGVTGRSTVELGYVQPWLDRRHTTLSAQIYDRVFVRFANSLTNGVGSIGNTDVGTDTRYNEQRTGATVSLSRPFKDTLSAAVSVRAENVRSNALALTPTNAEILQNGPIAILGGSLFHDTRDIILDPVTGGYQSANLQVGYANIKPVAGVTADQVTPGIFGKTTFAKTQLEFRQFISLTGPRKRLDEEKSTVALQLQLGASTGRLPFFEQFFVGGTESLRGYREDRFWGSYLMFGSVEFRQPLARSLKGVLFLDMGTAWGGSYGSGSKVNIEGFSQTGFQPHFGVGLGIRVRTPIGPLRLDYGIGQEGGRTHFSIGNRF